MRTGRWIAIAMCSSLVTIATGLLFLALSREVTGNSALRFAPYVALVLFAVTPLVAAAMSGSANWFASGAGGLAVGIAIIVAAAGLWSGNTGVMPLTLGIAIAGVIGLCADTRAHIWARLIATALLAVYAVFSGRLATLIFVYPLLGFADEFADAITARKRKGPPARETTSATTG